MSLSQFFNFLTHPHLPQGGGGGYAGEIPGAAMSKSGPPGLGFHNADRFAGGTGAVGGGEKPWLNSATSQARHPGIDWRLQLNRLGAALQDASPGSHGGHLDAIDNRRYELQDARAQEDHQRQQLNAWADSMGLSPSDRMLLSISPEQFFRLYGQGRVGGPLPSDFGE